jgi:cytochrome c2
MQKDKKRTFTILLLGALFCFTATLSGCGESGKKEVAVPEKKEAKKERFPVQKVYIVSDLFQGRKVFEDKNCSQCHSIFGKKEKLGPALDTIQFHGSFLDIFSILWNHAPAMAVHLRREGLPNIQFSTQEMNQLVSFLYMLPYLGKPGDSSKGEILLNNICFNCHSLAGRGKKGGIPLDTMAVYQSQIVLIQRMWNHGPVMRSQMLTTGTPMPLFSGNDMIDLIAALTKGQKQRKLTKITLGVGDVANGQKLFEKKNCTKCHSIFGKGGKIGPDLGDAISQSSVTELTALLWNHSPRMQEKMAELKLPYPYFSETEMSDLIVFLYSLNYEDKPGDLVNGEAVFDKKNCADCHFESEEDMQKYIAKIKMAATMVSQAVPWPELSGQEIRDILSFLQSQ